MHDIYMMKKLVAARIDQLPSTLVTTIETCRWWNEIKKSERRVVVAVTLFLETEAEMAAWAFNLANYIEYRVYRDHDAVLFTYLSIFTIVSLFKYSFQWYTLYCQYTHTDFVTWHTLTLSRDHDTKKMSIICHTWNDLRAQDTTIYDSSGQTAH